MNDEHGIKWINVDDEMPRDGLTVLIIFKGEWYKSFYIEHDEHFVVLDSVAPQYRNLLQTKDVTHWAYINLPEGAKK